LAQHNIELNSRQIRRRPPKELIVQGVRVNAVAPDMCAPGPLEGEISAERPALAARMPAGRPDAGVATGEPDQHIPRRVIKGGSHLVRANYCLRYRPAARQRGGGGHVDEPHRGTRGDSADLNRFVRVESTVHRGPATAARRNPRAAALADPIARAIEDSGRHGYSLSRCADIADTGDFRSTSARDAALSERRDTA
jgi:hypothetical protein